MSNLERIEELREMSEEEIMNTHNIPDYMAHTVKLAVNPEYVSLVNIDLGPEKVSEETGLKESSIHTYRSALRRVCGHTNNDKTYPKNLILSKRKSINYRRNYRRNGKNKISGL